MEIKVVGVRVREMAELCLRAGAGGFCMGEARMVHKDDEGYRHGMWPKPRHMVGLGECVAPINHQPLLKTHRRRRTDSHSAAEEYLRLTLNPASLCTHGNPAWWNFLGAWMTLCGAVVRQKHTLECSGVSMYHLACVKLC